MSESESGDEAPTIEFLNRFDTLVDSYVQKTAELAGEVHDEAVRAAEIQGDTMTTATNNVTSSLRDQYTEASTPTQTRMDATVQNSGIGDLFDKVMDFIGDIATSIGVGEIMDIIDCIKELIRCIFDVGQTLECILEFIDCVGENLLDIINVEA